MNECKQKRREVIFKKIKVYDCSFCDYSTSRRYDYNKHFIDKQFFT